MLLASASIVLLSVVVGSAVPAPSSSTAATTAEATIVHVLNRIGFGPRPGDIERVREMGIEKYIDQQLHPERLRDSGLTRRLEQFTTLQMSTGELADRYFVPALMERRERKRERAAADSGTSGGAPAEGARQGPNPARDVLVELSEQRLMRAIYGERQLEEVLVDFWFNHFNVFAGKGATRMYLTAYERDAIRPHVLGRFRTLLGAVAESPAMLFYLDNWMSSDPDGRDDVRARRRMTRMRAKTKRPEGLNENYARELMELHTLGVDGGYTQQDVVEVARAFTGWTIDRPLRQARGQGNSRGGFRFEPRMHDDKEKVVLGTTIRAGGGRKDGERVLDLLAAHPSTARFIATKLARRFVSDDPPQALIDRVAGRFRQTDGDIREVVRMILTSPEFLAPEARHAKVKSPLEFVVSAVRNLDADVRSAAPLAMTLRELGMPLYFAQPPTGYADTAETWVNSGALVNRMNFAVALLSNRVRGVSVDLGRLAGRGTEPGALTAMLLPGGASTATLTTIGKAHDETSRAALIIGSPEFQRR
jgi:uncharacterized protein (DUF1800 family)